ncbi:hypothetical protein BC941DRAFT_457687 [Chlamydoabsidia padenii]|nr:hypothetical protein BC941DRAFT_457687 [Chlamydoabsidia padenii]
MEKEICFSFLLSFSLSLSLMSLIRSAVNMLNQRVTGVVDDYDTICPATRIVPRRDWLLFLQRESQRANTTFYNECNRRGNYKAPANLNRTNELLPCNCNAYIKVTSSEDNPDQVEIEYNWKHDNHVPGSVDDMAIAPISRDARLVLQDLVESHFNWKSIKGILRQDRAKLAVMLEMGTNANIEESHRLSKQNRSPPTGNLLIEKGSYIGVDPGVNPMASAVSVDCG